MLVVGRREKAWENGVHVAPPILHDTIGSLLGGCLSTIGLVWQPLLDSSPAARGPMPSRLPTTLTSGPSSESISVWSNIVYDMA